MRRDDSVIIYTGRGASRTLKRGVKNCERGKKRVEYIHTHTHIYVRMRREGLKKRRWKKKEKKRNG